MTKEKYNRKWTKEKNHLEHRYFWQQEFGTIPKGLVVHHIDGNPKNNDIDNLCLLTMTAHNRIHAHPAWNKGLTTKTNKKWSKTIRKIKKVKFINYLSKCKKAVELQLGGMKLREIAMAQGISRRQVSDRIKTYKNYVKNDKTTKGNGVQISAHTL